MYKFQCKHTCCSECVPNLNISSINSECDLWKNTGKRLMLIFDDLTINENNNDRSNEFFYN